MTVMPAAAPFRPEVRDCLDRHADYDTDQPRNQLFPVHNWLS